MVDGRNRKNIFHGSPDVQAAGGIEIGVPATSREQFPTAIADVLEDLELKPAGYIGEEGITKQVARTVEKIRDWNKDTVELLETEHTTTLRLKFLEAANATVLRAIAGADNVTVEEGRITVLDAAGELPHVSLRATMNGGNGGKLQITAPDVQATEFGDIVYRKDGLLEYEATFECFPVDGVKLVTLMEKDTIEAEADAEGEPGAAEVEGS